MPQEFTRNRITLNASSGDALVIGASDSNVLKTVHTVPANAQDNVILEVVTGGSVTTNFEVSIYKNADLVKTLAVVGGKKSTVEVSNLQAGDLIKIKHPLSLSVNTDILPDTPSVTDGLKWYSNADPYGPYAGSDSLGSATLLATPGTTPTNVHQYHYYPSAGLAVWYDNASYTWRMYEAATSTVVSSVQDSTYYSNTYSAAFSDRWIVGKTTSYTYTIAVDLESKTLSAGRNGSGSYYELPMSATNDPDQFFLFYSGSSYVYVATASGTSFTNIAQQSIGYGVNMGDAAVFPDGNTYMVVGGTGTSNALQVLKWDGSSITTYSSTGVTSGVYVTGAIAIPQRNELWLFGYNAQDGASSDKGNAYKFNVSTSTWTKYVDAIGVSDGFTNATTQRKLFYSATDDLIWLSQEAYSGDVNQFLGFDPDTQTITRTAKYFSDPNAYVAVSTSHYPATLGSGSGEYYTTNLSGNGPYIRRASDDAVYHDSSRSDRGGAYSTCWGPMSLHVASSTMYRFEDDRNVYLYDVGSTPMSWRSADTTVFTAYSTSSTYARVLFNWVDDANDKLYYTDYFGALYSFDINPATGALSNNTLLSSSSTAQSLAVPGATYSTGYRPVYLPSSGYHMSFNSSTGYMDVGDVRTETRIDGWDSSPYSISGYYNRYAQHIAVYTEGGYDYCAFMMYYSGTYYLQFLRVSSTGAVTALGTPSLNSTSGSHEIASWVDTGNATYPHRFLYVDNAIRGINVNMKTGQRSATVVTTTLNTDLGIDANPSYVLVMPHKKAIGGSQSNIQTNHDQYVGAVYYSPPSGSGVGGLAVSPAMGGRKMSNDAYTLDGFDQSTAEEKNNIIASFSTKTDGYVNRVTTTA